MRVFLLDDAHKNVFLCEWAGLPQGDYLRLQAEGKEGIVLESVAQQLVADCRGDFQRSLFVLLSNDQKLLERLHDELERSHAGLSQILRLPLPESELKEKIVRTNINRLNRQSYWYIEFTAYLQPDMRGLDDYLRGKVDVYATLLESV